MLSVTIKESPASQANNGRSHLWHTFWVGGSEGSSEMHRQLLSFIEGLLCATWHVKSSSIFIASLRTKTIVPALQMSKLRFQEARGFAHGHLANVKLQNLHP